MTHTALIHGRPFPDSVQPPLVSIVLVSWNHASYVGQAIKSVRQQDYPLIECFIIDNASRDNSRAVIEEAVGADARFTVIYRADNAGQMGAISEILDRIRGDFVAFLDSDDVLFENFVSCHVQAHLAVPRSVSVTSNKVIEISQEGRVLTSGTISFAWGCENDQRGLKPAATVMRLQSISESDYDSLSAETIMVPHWRSGVMWSPGTANMYRTKLVKMLWPENGLTPACATEGYFNLLFHAFTGTALIDRTLSAYRIHGANKLAAMEAMNSLRTSRREEVSSFRDDRMRSLDTLLARASTLDWLMFGDRFWFTLDQQAARPHESLAPFYASAEVCFVLAKNVGSLIAAFGFDRVVLELNKRLPIKKLTQIVTAGTGRQPSLRFWKLVIGENGKQRVRSARAYLLGNLQKLMPRSS